MISTTVCSNALIMLLLIHNSLLLPLCVGASIVFLFCGEVRSDFIHSFCSHFAEEKSQKTD